MCAALMSLERSPSNRRLACLVRWLADPFAQELLALFSALATLSLGAAEEFGELLVFGTLRVLDVDLQSQDVTHALLQEPDDVVVLVTGPRNPAGLSVLSLKRGTRHNGLISSARERTPCWMNARHISSLCLPDAPTDKRMRLPAPPTGCGCCEDRGMKTSWSVHTRDSAVAPARVVQGGLRQPSLP